MGRGNRAYKSEKRSKELRRIKKQEAKLLLNYGHFAYDDKKANNEVILATQFSF